MTVEHCSQITENCFWTNLELDRSEAVSTYSCCIVFFFQVHIHIFLSYSFTGKTFFILMTGVHQIQSAKSRILAKIWKEWKLKSAIKSEFVLQEQHSHTLEPMKNIGMSSDWLRVALLRSEISHSIGLFGVVTKTSKLHHECSLRIILSLKRKRSVLSIKDKQSVILWFVGWIWC